MNELNKIEAFKIFCLEMYKADRKLTGEMALTIFNKHQVFSYLEEGFEVLHTQGAAYILSEIVQFINSRQ